MLGGIAAGLLLVILMVIAASEKAESIMNDNNRGE
jgi:hypothetical protein